MTPEERLNTLLSETEDVAREDQIFLQDGVEMAIAQPRFSLSAYNGDIDVIFDETQKIANTFKLPMDIVVAKNSKDYVSAMIAHGVSEDKVVIESAAVYLDWEDIIIVNAENIYNRLHYVSVLSHENMHSVTRSNKEAVYAVAKKLPIMQVLKFAESELGYSLDYIKKNLKDVSFEVTDEIISTFVETIAVMPVNTGGDVFYRYLTGSLTTDEAMEACELGIANMYNGEYKAITDAAKPLLRDNLTILKDERYKAKRVGNALIWGEGGTPNERGGANNEASDEKFSTELQSSQGDESGTSGGGTREDAQEVTLYSISAPSYTDRMVDISDVMTVAEHKAAMLEEAKRMASEGVDAQKIGRKVVRIYIQGRS